MLFWLVSPLSAIWAIVYYGLSLGGPHSATVGMRVMDLQLRTFSGEPGYFLLGAAHAVLYWISVSVLTPFIVLVGLFNRRKQLLHDLVLGTVIINTSAQHELEPARRADVCRGGCGKASLWQHICVYFIRMIAAGIF